MNALCFKSNLVQTELIHISVQVSLNIFSLKICPSDVMHRFSFLFIRSDSISFLPDFSFSPPTKTFLSSDRSNQYPTIVYPPNHWKYSFPSPRNVWQERIITFHRPSRQTSMYHFIDRLVFSLSFSCHRSQKKKKEMKMFTLSMQWKSLVSNDCRLYRREFFSKATGMFVNPWSRDDLGLLTIKKYLHIEPMKRKHSTLSGQLLCSRIV